MYKTIVINFIYFFNQTCYCVFWSCAFFVLQYLVTVIIWDIYIYIYMCGLSLKSALFFVLSEDFFSLVLTYNDILNLSC